MQGSAGKGNGNSNGSGGIGGSAGSGGSTHKGTGGGGAHMGTGGGGGHMGTGGSGAGGAAMDDEDAGAPDQCPNDPLKTEPGLCGCGVVDDPTDTDFDGTPDCVDQCPTDVNKTAPGNCGCGAGESTTMDSDGDGTNDCADHCYLDKHKTEPGVCGCGNPDTDTDGDGTLDCNDGCIYNPDKVTPGVCGCFMADVDSDNDGVMDCVDNCPGLANADQLDADHDGAGAACDCNDGNPKIYPNHPELCDSLDNDCDNQTDEGDPDGDGVTGCNCAWQAGTLSWRDIIGAGTQVTGLAGADDDATSIPVGFPFPFSGASYSSVIVSSNGFLMFGSNNYDDGSASVNTEVPDPKVPNGVIAPFWDDLVNDGDGIVYAVSGSSPDREFVVSWLNVKLFTDAVPDPNTRMSFQVILHEDGGIEFQYQNASDASTGANGGGATIGYETVSGEEGMPYSFNQAMLTYPSNLERVCN
jgi:hypothetical protein